MHLNYNYYTVNYKNAMKLYASWIRSIFISAILRLGHFLSYISATEDCSNLYMATNTRNEVVINK